MRIFASFSRFRRLTIRHERHLDVLAGFHLPAACPICLKVVTR
ncbi:MAG TPA: hypothetical protein VHL31_22385 [Geminicoccus sp.]|jgi:hypothetical protein|nr:hypothetical protein [Geminicoccus sp.]HEX2529031.1 hypothetical protein [Geminicoccus sp.]